MAVVDDKTPFLQLPLPHRENRSDDDVERLRDAYLMLDAFAQALSIAVSGKAAQEHQHGMDAITGLLDALASKAGNDHQHSLASLTDTDLSEVANGKFFKFVGNKWIPATILAGDVPSFEEAINARLPMTGGNLTGPLMAIDRLVAQATANGNAHVWLHDTDGKNRGLVYWDRNSGAVSLRVYADDGNGTDIVVGNLVLHANGTMTFNNNAIYNSGDKATAAQIRAGTANTVLTSDGVWAAAGYVGLSGAAGSTLAAGTYAPNFGAGLNFYNVLAGNITLGNPTNAKAGQTGLIVLQQDTTGGRTVAFGSAWRFANGNAPSMNTAASRTNVIAYQVLHSGFVICSSIAGLV